MIILITGIPGSGKTSHAVDLLANDPQFQNRPLFVNGVPELKIPHEPAPPFEDWVEFRSSEADPTVSLPYFTFPPQSIVLVDESQRFFRPRTVGSKVPPQVQAFETHRHTGVDFILITQHPNLIDSNIRKLVGRHLHVHVHGLGRELLDWPRIADPDSKSDREIAVRKSYKPPSRVFDLYKSAEAHTVIKRPIPRAVYVVGAALFLTVALGWFGYSRISSRLVPPAKTTSAPSQNSTARHDPSSSGTTAEYLDSLRPRIPGLAYTAPRYDDITKPTDAPYPQACLINHKTNTCRCIDQQGHRYAAPQGLCEQIVENGLFRDWAPPQQQTAPAAAAPASQAAHVSHAEPPQAEFRVEPRVVAFKP